MEFGVCGFCLGSWTAMNFIFLFSPPKWQKKKTGRLEPERTMARQEDEEKQGQKGQIWKENMNEMDFKMKPWNVFLLVVLQVSLANRFIFCSSSFKFLWPIDLFALFSPNEKICLDKGFYNQGQFCFIFLFIKINLYICVFFSLYHFSDISISMV